MTLWLDLVLGPPEAAALSGPDYFFLFKKVGILFCSYNS